MVEFNLDELTNKDCDCDCDNVKLGSLIIPRHKLISKKKVKEVIEKHSHPSTKELLNQIKKELGLEE